MSRLFRRSYLARVISASLVLCWIWPALFPTALVHAGSQSPFTCLVVNQDGFTLSTAGYARDGDTTSLEFELIAHDQVLRSVTVWTAGWELIEPVVGAGHVGTDGRNQVQLLPSDGQAGAQAIRFVPITEPAAGSTVQITLVMRGFDPTQYTVVEVTGSHTATTFPVDFAHPACAIAENNVVPHIPSTRVAVDGQPEFQSHVVLASDFSHVWSAGEQRRLWEIGLPVPDVVTTTHNVFDLAGGSTGQVGSSATFFALGGWTPIFQTGFEDGLPRRAVNDGCQLVTLSAGHSVRWTVDTVHGFDGSVGSATVAGPGQAGANAQQPAHETSPAQAQMVCIFDDLAQAHNLMVQFALRMGTADRDISFFAGISTDGQTFLGRRWRSTIQAETQPSSWSQQRLFLPFPGEMTGDAGRVAVLWAVQGSVGPAGATGIGLDDVRVERYDRQPIGCRNLDPRIEVSGAPGSAAVSKGVNVPAYPVETPAGLEGHVERMRASAVGWARLEFLAPIPPSQSAFGLDGPGGLLTYVDFKHYDTFVDLLCSGDPPIATLGLLDYGTLPNQSWRSYGQIGDEYQAAFTVMAGLLARYYQDRIGHWEIWNEPDFGPTYLQPYAYAGLLEAVSERVKSVDPDAQILFGGLGGADDVAASYFRRVLGALPSSPPPYDIFAIHPYPSHQFRRQGQLIRDPSYLLYEQPTILTKFLDIMRAAGHATRPIWITEIGWNRAADSSNSVTLACRRVYETMVTGDEQARYLAIQFDILFRETAWEPGIPSVVKVFWYQYMDVGLRLTAAECRTNWQSVDAGPPRVVDWWYGLFSGTDPEAGMPEPAANRSACTFRAYPNGEKIQACLELPETAFP